MSSDGTAHEFDDCHRRIEGFESAPMRVVDSGVGLAAGRRAKAGVVLIELDASRRGTLAEQVVNAIRRMVEHRELRPETRLPSIRQVAAAHGISKCTVVQAYDRLAATGHIQSRPGAGFYVRALA